MQSKDAVEAREARRAPRPGEVRARGGAVDETGAVVETDDADSRVFADSEGTGSQGRELSDETSLRQPDAESSESTGITIDKDGRTHLDLQA